MAMKHQSNGYLVADGCRTWWLNSPRALDNTGKILSIGDLKSVSVGIANECPVPNRWIHLLRLACKAVVLNCKFAETVNLHPG